MCDLIKYWVETYNPSGSLFQIHITSPFLEPSTISQAAEYLHRGHDSVVSCNRHLARFWFKSKPVNHDPKLLIQTQDLEPLMEENSLFYGFTREVALNNLRIGTNPFWWATSPSESYDIDTEHDWDICLKILEDRRCQN